MDREILFRGKVSGKRLNKGEWIEGNLVHQLDCYGKPCDKYFILNKYDTNDYEIGEPIQVDPATVGQFTGLVDKNGVRIFEGDVLKDEQHGLIMTVCYNTKLASFALRSEGWMYLHYFQEAVKPDDVEVIGNTHDNKEEE